MAGSPPLTALVTRPHDDAATLAAALAERGIGVVLEPLLTIRPVAVDSLPLDDIQALLFTSANGVRAFAAASPRRDLPAFAVGDATAATARQLGFAQVASAGGDVADLARLVQREVRPGDGALLHAAGSAIAGDLAGTLHKAGYAYRRAVLYSAEPAARLTPATAEALRSGAVDLALFFSPRTAATFVRLAAAEGADLVSACRRVAALALSPAVSEALKPLPWNGIHAAAAPTQRELLAALDDFLAARHPAAGANERQGRSQ